MIRNVTTNRLVASALAADLVVLPCELVGGLDRLSTTRGEEDPVQISGGERSQLLGEFNGPGVGISPQGPKGEFARLLGSSFAKFDTTMAELRSEQRSETVEVSISSRVPDVAAFALDDDRNFAFRCIGTHAAEVQPGMTACRLGQPVRRVFVGFDAVGNSIRFIRGVVDGSHRVPHS